MRKSKRRRRRRSGLREPEKKWWRRWFSLVWMIRSAWGVGVCSLRPCSRFSLPQPRDQRRSCPWWTSRVWRRVPPPVGRPCSWKDTTSSSTPRWCLWKRPKVRKEGLWSSCVCVYLCVCVRSIHSTSDVRTFLGEVRKPWLVLTTSKACLRVEARI